MTVYPEKKESLWVLTASPVIWSAHFLLSYITAAVWCAKVVGRDGSLWGARLAIVVYTLVALVGIGIVGWRGYRRQRRGSGVGSYDLDTPRSRHRFLGFATLLLSALSAVGVLYDALVVFFLSTCH